MPRVIALLFSALLFFANTHADEAAEGSSRADPAAEERRLNDLAFDLMIEGQTRIMGVADRIRIAGAELCGKKIAPVIGVFAVD